jgi:hypothetical protein
VLQSPSVVHRLRRERCPWVNLADICIAKSIQFGRKRLNVGLDIFNSFNINVVLNSNNTYGPAWLTPTAAQLARQMQASAKFDF